MTLPIDEQLHQLLSPTPRRLAVLETPRGLTGLRWMIGVVLVLGLLSCSVKGANSPADPYLAPAGGSATGARTSLAGFGETRISVQTPDQLLEWCLLLASTPEQRRRGLMEVTDQSLGGHDGMLFRYDTDVQEPFWMRNTPMPLSIAWIDASGQIVASADMAPCEDSDQCPNYPATGSPPPYRFAIEVPQGQLAALGLVEGSTITDQQTACA